MNIAALLAAYKPGHSLGQAFYSDPGIFARDMEMLSGRWLCVGHVSELPTAGDWLTAELGRESAIVTRRADGEFSALANVCRHRGSRICTLPHGHGPTLTCPYHGWTYRLDGSLRRAPEMPEGFDPAAHGLLPLPLKIIGGLIFLSFADHPPAIEASAAALDAMARRHGWDTGKIAARKTYTIASNWKLAVENYHECYHCAGSHLNFRRCTRWPAPATAGSAARMSNPGDRRPTGTKCSG